MQALDRAQAIDHYNAMQRHWEKKQKTMPSYYTNYYEWQIRAFNKVREYQNKATYASQAPEHQLFNIDESEVQLLRSSVDPKPKKAQPKAKMSKSQYIRMVEEEEEMLADVVETIQMLKLVRKTAKKQGQSTSDFTARIVLAQKEKKRCENTLDGLYDAYDY